MRRVELADIANHFDFFIDDESKEIVIRSNDEYSTVLELSKDYSISVDGNMFVNYNGKIFIGSFSKGETIGMSLEEIRGECERLHEERMKEIEAMMDTYNSVEYNFGIEYTNESSNCDSNGCKI